MKKILLLFLLSTILNIKGFSQKDFITTWKLNSNQTEIKFNATTNGTAKYIWQILPNGVKDSGLFVSGVININGLPNGSTIRLYIKSDFLLSFKSNIPNFNTRLLSIDQWGKAKWNNMKSAFEGCSKMKVYATDTPDLSMVTEMDKMFMGCNNLSTIAGINGWNTSNVISMSELFRDAILFDQNLSDWNTSKVLNMKGLFHNANRFNQDINNWNTSKVTDMENIFSNAISFNQPLNDWDVSSVTNMKRAFASAGSFNHPINNWNTENVKNMEAMFRSAESFNQNLNEWNTTQVSNMKFMFSYAKSFNEKITNWDVSNVQDMTNMFANASVFNQDIGLWNTSNVQSMRGLFKDAKNFNQDIGAWNTNKVELMSEMFDGANSFNQNIGNWNTENVKDMSSMFNNAHSFNQSIENWNTLSVENMSSMFANASNFNQNINNWNISNVKYMNYMFQNAIFFNQPLNNWDVSSLIRVFGMFENAFSFNQNLGNWKFSSLTNCEKFLDNCGMSCFNYSNTIKGLSYNPLTPNDLKIGVSGRKYNSETEVDRSFLITFKGWDFVGDAINPNPCDEASPFLNINTRSIYMPLQADSISIIQSFLISGNNLSEDILIYVDENFGVSNFIDSGFTAQLNITHQNGVIEPRLVFVQFSQTEFGNYYGKAFISSDELKDTILLSGYKMKGYVSFHHPKSEQIEVFPNPVSSVLNVKLKKTQEIQIIDLHGKSLNKYSGENEYRINVSLLNPAVYFIKTSEGHVMKFIKN